MEKLAASKRSKFCVIGVSTHLMNSLSSSPLFNSCGKLIARGKVLVPGGQSLSHTNKTSYDCSLIDCASVRRKGFTGKDSGEFMEARD